MMSEAASAQPIVDNLMGRFDEVLTDNSTDELGKLLQTLKKDVEAYKGKISKSAQGWKTAKRDNNGLHKATQQLKDLSESSRDLIKSVDHLFKMIEDKNRDNGDRTSKKNLKEVDEVRRQAVEQLKLVRYFYRHATWLQERFPEAKLRDVEGLVKLVDKKEIKDNDWSLTPGRYVGVAPEEEDENFDFEETLRDIHMELAELNKEAMDLASKIQKNFEELGI
jgi:type I restriction enzyme M protein